MATWLVPNISDDQNRAARSRQPGKEALPSDVLWPLILQELKGDEVLRTAAAACALEAKTWGERAAGGDLPRAMAKPKKRSFLFFGPRGGGSAFEGVAFVFPLFLEGALFFLGGGLCFGGVAPQDRTPRTMFVCGVVANWLEQKGPCPPFG